MSLIHSCDLLQVPQVTVLIDGTRGEAWIEQLESILITNTVDFWAGKTLHAGAVNKLSVKWNHVQLIQDVYYIHVHKVHMLLT